MKWFLIFFLFSCGDKEVTIEKPLVEEQKVEEKSFARFINIKGNIERKSGEELVWKPAKMETALYLQDWVKTLDDSQCLLELNKKVDIRMEPNSVLVILESLVTAKLEKDLIGFDQGEIDIDTKSYERDYEVIVKTPGAWISVGQNKEEGKPSKVKISYQGKDKIQIKSLVGKVKVLWEDKEESLESGKTKELNISPDTLNYYNAPPKKVVIQKEVLVDKIFSLTSHKGGEVVDTDSIRVSGILPTQGKVYFKGKQVIGQGTFSLSVKLERGINSLTFQLIKDKKVTYKTIEIIRK